MQLPLCLGSGLPLFPGFPVRGSLAVSLASASTTSSINSGIARVSQVLDASLHAYHALCGPRQTLQDLTTPRSLRVGFWAVNTIAICSIRFNGAVSSFGECGLPCGLRDSLCTLQLFRSGLSSLLLSCNTRYEWLVKPYSTGTFTRPEAPSFAWRTNDVHQPRSRLARRWPTSFLYFSSYLVAPAA